MAPGRDHGFAQPFHVGEEVGTAVLGDHLTQESSQESHVGPELVRHLRDGVVSFGWSDGGHGSKASESPSVPRDRSHQLD
ncbi:hypothetical protein GCM10009530_51700 [Microbispora corallina]|uniref:Uncharacterized protein n=1 Tax=Microbispora corallina TaxID=83302 RepID=A0ABQ4G6Q3_9ACTN|nr:hypothetical protein Mco01_57630 [Microbispora corallina]